MRMETKLELQGFYPTELDIADVNEAVALRFFNR